MKCCNCPHLSKTHTRFEAEQKKNRRANCEFFCSSPGICASNCEYLHHDRSVKRHPPSARLCFGCRSFNEPPRSTDIYRGRTKFVELRVAQRIPVFRIFRKPTSLALCFEGEPTMRPLQSDSDAWLVPLAAIHAERDRCRLSLSALGKRRLHRPRLPDSPCCISESSVRHVAVLAGPIEEARPTPSEYQRNEWSGGGFAAVPEAGQCDLHHEQAGLDFVLLLTLTCRYESSLTPPDCVGESGARFRLWAELQEHSVRDG
jgi:hypothetical protein